ncbi:DUF4133 domain-containing protein [Algoriphagus terrigena]|uniref:DUF4133 domain-containing protein n=1 Tax=Algoriphagus terrigena TaxID=344884 RepID=UPI00041E33DD|nr:DUF4133 domain-containing protein [Algoriphagus terrigena]
MIRYKINKGVNKPIEFKGLKSQYIAYLAAGLCMTLVVFGFAYALGVSMLLCLGIAVSLGTLLCWIVFSLNARFGEHGLMKQMARRQIPASLTLRDRTVFTRLIKI